MNNVILVFGTKHTVNHLVHYLSIVTAYKCDSFSMCLHSNLNSIYGFWCAMMRKEAKYPGNAAFPLFRGLLLDKGVSHILQVYLNFRYLHCSGNNHYFNLENCSPVDSYRLGLIFFNLVAWIW